MTTDTSTPEARLLKIENDIAEIRARNRRVESNKAWETSGTRLLAVACVTYITMTLIFRALGSARPLLDALVPTAGFVLSTLSLTLVRKIWEKRREG